MHYRLAAMIAMCLAVLACVPALAQVTSVTVVEKAGVTTANYPMTISMVFKQGDVASCVTAQIGGQNLTTQTDVKVRWPDNSIKHALVSFVIPSMPAGGSVTVNFLNGGTNANSSYTTKAQLLATDFDARMTITPAGGSATTITARNLLNGIASPEYWIQGQVCSEFLIRDFSQNISNQLNVQYYVRYYPGWSGFRVDTVVENCWTEYRGNLTYDFNLLLGNSNPQSVFAKTGFTHNINARWHKVFWQGNTPPAVEVRYNLAYLTSTKILPNYDTSLVVPEATISSAYSSWQSSNHDIMQNGIIATYFPTTGGRQEIGPYPTWAARYLLSMDNRMKEITLNCGDLSGSIPIHLREGNPAKSARNHILTIDDRPTVWVGWWDYTYQDPADKLPAPIGSTTTDWSVDGAHQASFACIPYLITGDFYYLEEMYFWAGWNLANSNHAYRGDAQGLLVEQTRGIAWTARNLADPADLAPDTHTLEKSYFTQKMNNNINSWINTYITTGNYPSIHYWQDQSNIGADGGRPDSDLVTTCRYYTSPWMDDFVLIILTHLKDKGWNTSSMVDWLGVSIIERFHNPNYNWYRGAPYHIPTAYNDGNNNGIRYATWADVDNAFVAQPGPSDFPNPDYASSYNFIARAAMAGVTHLTNGQTTWNWLDSHLYSKSSLNDDPTWGLLPRGYTPPSDSTAPATVSNLAAGNPTTSSLTLTWTAPGDDNNTGTATSYDIRYRTGGAVNDSNWASATQVTGEPTPAVAGTNQNMVVSGLSASTTYYFAIKTSDEVPNTSLISNSPSGTTSASSGILQVGPGKTYATVQDAVNAAVDGNTIEIYSSTYTQSAGWATVNKNNLTLRGMGTRPILDANGSCLSGKGIFIITGTGTTVENLEFKNARNTTDKNAAGIRQEGANLTVRNCYFHDNDDGILANAVTGSSVFVETSEFYHNGYGDGGSHNVYCNAVDAFTMQYCYSHGAAAGHEVKTRARVSKILYNRIGNEGGTGSYEIDVPNGGTTYIIGNQIEQSSTTGNPTIISYGAEGTTNPDQHLYVVNNTIVNNRTSGTFVYNYSTTSALLENTIFQGAGTVLTGPGTQTTDWTTTDASLADPAGYDFHLTSGSTGAINAGTTPGTGIDGFNMNPTRQYVHPCTSQARPASGTIDIGAYEYVSGTPTVQFSSTSSSGSEATSPANLTVTLSASSTSTISVDYAVTGGTATEGSDYTLPATGNTIVALKRDAGLIQGGAIDSRFTSLGAGDVVLAGVKDAVMYSAGNGRYMNWGTAADVEGYLVIAFDLSSYAGATINKAQLRLRSSQGNSTMQIAQVKSHDWPEGNKNGDYPGVAPAIPGVTWVHPSATNTTITGPLGWGTNSDAMFDPTSNGQDIYTLVDFTSMPGGAAWVVAEMTSYVQDWVSSGKPNYGVFVVTGNHKPSFSEAGTDNQPVLFLDITLPQRKVTFSPGETSKTIPITIINDTTGEPAETIQVTLSNPVGATLGGTTAHTYTINDNDMPTVQFGQAASSGSEATTSVSIPVTLSASSSNTVTVDYDVTGGTATQGSDYTLPLGGNQVIALKRDAGLVQGGALDSRFTGLTGSNVVTATVKDALVSGGGNGAFMNYGTTDWANGYWGGPSCTFGWNLAAYAGGIVNKAQIRIHCTMGNSNMWYAGIKTHDWTEGNKNGDYPGVAPATAGICWNHPNGTYTAPSGAFGWGTASNAAFDETANTGDVYDHVDFISIPGGDAYVVADVTSLVQDWLSGAKPNYGLYVNIGNHSVHLSEIGTDNEPVLFLDVTLPQRQVTFSPGQTSKTIPITVINDTTGEYNETIQVTLSNPANATLGGNTVHTYTITDNDVLDCVATAETPVYGTVTGTYANTQASDNVYESIREVLRAGYTYSWCEHRWTYNVRAGSSIQFRVEAYRPSNPDSDNFQFAYSTNGTNWTNMVSITKTSDNNTDQTYSLPAGTSGTVYVRVIDTNRSNNRGSLDYLYIDRMVIRSNP